MSGGDLQGRMVDTFRRSQFPKFMVQGGIACGKFYCMEVEYRFWIVCRGSYIRRSKILIEAGRKSISNCDRETFEERLVQSVAIEESDDGEIWYCKGP